jgi:hypothetical protein
MTAGIEGQRRFSPQMDIPPPTLRKELKESVAVIWVALEL